MLLHQFLGIGDQADGGDGIQAEPGADQKRLRVRIADAADTDVSVEAGEVFFKLRPEGRILNVVDLTLEPVLLIVDDHSTPARTQVGVIVHTEEDVQRNIPFGNCPEKSAHTVTFPFCN